MLSLVDYESSDEEGANISHSPSRQKDVKGIVEAKSGSLEEFNRQDNHEARATPEQNDRLNETPSVASGPLLGPSQPQQTITTSEHVSPGPNHLFLDSNARSLIHELTLPPIPNLDIPPSPPGSPDPTANAKFSHFATLKSQGIHFNAKLASSSSLKNPNLLQTMMKHAGIAEDEQYLSSLSDVIWNPLALPQWGFKEELSKMQKSLRARVEEGKAAGQRGSIEFVTSSAHHSRPVDERAEANSVKNG